MIRRAILATTVAVALALTGCTPGTGTASSSPSPEIPDFRKPGAAKAMVEQLLADAESQQALMVKVSQHNVEVSVLKDDKVVTWANRSGTVTQVASDLAYVDQATFDVDGYQFDNVGALFRAAAGQSGSEANQSLTIVDYSGGKVMMSVSTEPESRTVFFTSSGSLLEILDFNTEGGVVGGVATAIGGRTTIYSLSVISDQSVSVEFPGANDTTIRRARAQKVPVTTTVRSGATNLPLYATSVVDPRAIWRVVQAQRGEGGISENSTWSVTIDNREKRLQPRMYFTFGFTVVVTDLAGDVIDQ
ncbi:MAG TPA: hypothetical protein PKD84_01890 [Propionicimonas sp.]|nr:hypothetical protein [Propionicimonas sp.]